MLQGTGSLEAVGCGRQVDRRSLPTNGTVLAAITNGKEDADEDDREYPQRLKETIY